MNTSAKDTEDSREQEKRELLKRISVTSLSELQDKILEAVESMDNGECENGEIVMARLMARAKASRSKKQ